MSAVPEDTKKEQPQPQEQAQPQALPQERPPFPPLGRMIAWVPSRAASLPSVTHMGHRKFRVHLHGFHCVDCKDFLGRQRTLTFPEDEARTAEIFAYREEKKAWTQSTKAERKVFADLEDSDEVLLAALGPDPRVAFSKVGDWGQKGHCQFGDCLYAVIMAYVPNAAFAKGAQAKRG